MTSAMQPLRCPGPLALVLLSVAVATGGCGYPKAPAYPHQAADFEPVEVKEPPGLASDPPPPLTLQPGDAVTIEVRSEQNQTLSDLVIDAPGKVHLPLAGDVVIGGLSLAEAEDAVQQALKKYDRFVHVSLRVSDRGGQRATVLGAVNSQGTVALVPGARVTDVIAGAGGPITAPTGPNPVPVADLASAQLMRDGKALPISFPKALRGDPRHNVYVHPGDHLYIPPATGKNISILGQVGTPTVFPHRDDLRLSEALALAGGITVGGDKGDLRVIRGTLEKPLVYEASLRDFVDGDSHDVMLAPGDIVFVTDHPIEDFSEVMSLITPILSLGMSSAVLAVTLDRTSDE